MMPTLSLEKSVRALRDNLKLVKTTCYMYRPSPKFHFPLEFQVIFNVLMFISL